MWFLGVVATWFPLRIPSLGRPPKNEAVQNEAFKDRTLSSRIPFTKYCSWYYYTPTTDHRAHCARVRVRARVWDVR